MPSREGCVPYPSSARIPVYLTRLVGREGEIGEVRRLLESNRLVSLVGAGGSGKTRMAAAAAETFGVANYDDVGWVDLTTQSDPASVPGHLARTLGLREPIRGTDLGALVARLAGTPILLVLDNCEHVLAACARLVDSLLRECPELRVLATSRQALGVVGEKVFPVPPLALPDGDPSRATEAAAVQLFVQRAHDALPSFRLTESNAEAVIHICRRLDGLPLALELAAARVRVLSPDQLSRRLDSMLSLLSTDSQVRLPRHRTLRAMVDWSYELLTEDERLLLHRLTVFSGGFTLESAEAVAGEAPLSPGRVLELLASLVERSLVTVLHQEGEGRYALLETVRQYAAEHLEASSEAVGLRRRHAGHFLELAERAEPHILGGTLGTPWMRRLETEHANLRAAMEWFAQDDQGREAELRFGASLHWFHFALSRFKEPREHLQRALERADGTPGELRGRSLATLGYLAFWMGDLAAARAHLEDAAALLRGGGPRTDVAFALTGQATVSGLTGESEVAEELFQEALTALGDTSTLGPEDFPRALTYTFAHYWRGVVAQSHGDVELARSSFERCVGVARMFDNHPTVGHPLTALARVLVLQGELAAAEECLAEGVALHVAHEDRWGLVQATEVGALLMSRLERPEPGARLLGAADRIRQQIGASRAPHEKLERDALAQALSTRLSPGAYEQAWSEGSGMSLQELRSQLDSPSSARASTGTEAIGAEEPPMITGERDGSWRPTSGAEGARAADLEIRALGPLEIHLLGRPMGGDAFASSKPRELLLLLLCHRAGLSRDQVGLLFWPEASTTQVKNSFHVTLHRLRKALERPEWIVTTGDRYRVDPAITVDFDVERFQSLAEEVLRSPLQDEQAAGRLRQALELYRGDFLEGEVVGDWAVPVRDRLRRLCLDGWLAVGRFELALGRFADAAAAFRGALARDRMHEEGSRLLMSCLARNGSRTEALRLYETLRILLREELGTAPDEETTALYEELGGRSPSRPSALPTS